MNKLFFYFSLGLFLVFLNDGQAGGITLADSIYSIQLQDSSFSLSAPILRLGEMRNLQLAFDQLGDEHPAYFCKVQHCDANFSPSNLMTNEYFEGGLTIPITHYLHSINTVQAYVHCTASIPGEYGKFTKSGNYDLQVFSDRDPQQLIFSVHFKVVESLLDASAQIKPSTVIEEQKYKQQVDFVLDCNRFQVDNPFDNLQVNLSQNQRTDNAKTNLKPSLVHDNVLVYNGDDGSTVFSGGNEFRGLNLKSLHYTNETVSKIYRDSAGWQAILTPEDKKSFKRYAPYGDIGGRCLFYNQDGSASDQSSGNDAEYVHAHFFLPNTPFEPDGEYYLMGELVRWQLTNRGKFIYNLKKNGYELDLYLKQGYYDYQIVFLPHGSNVADETIFEGMHSETSNEYTITCYYHDPLLGYDRIILLYHLSNQK